MSLISLVVVGSVTVMILIHEVWSVLGGCVVDERRILLTLKYKEGGVAVEFQTEQGTTEHI